MSVIKKLNEKYPLFMEIVRFVIVGGLATLADMLVMGVVLYAFDSELYPHFYNVWYGGGEPSTLATVVGTGAGFLTGLVINYVLSVIFVFNEKGKSKSAYGFIVFTVLSAVGLGIHLGGMYIGYDLLHINEWIVKIFLTAVVMVYNYVSKKLILFKKAKKTVEEQKAVKEESREESYVFSLPEGESMKKLSIVVPCYNEEECIPLFYERTGEVVEKLPVDTEFIFVDDGSKDKTLTILRDLAEKDPRVRYISFSRNFGKEAAILAGLRETTGDYVSLMDADLQDPPELLIDMYKCISDMWGGAAF